MALEHYLVLNRYMLDQLGFASFEDLKSGVEKLPEGPKGDGSSYWLGGLLVPGSKLDEAALREYDRLVMQREAELRKARGQFNFKYFQYLAVLFTEIYLDKLTSDPEGFLNDLNQFLVSLKSKEPHLGDIPEFTLPDLRKLAFFMATGSGKTLLMHVHIKQVQHYIKHGAHPEVLVTPQKSGRAEFAHILLVTPSEELSTQHLNEFRTSNISAVHLSNALNNPYAYADHVKVIEIHKLTEENGGGGVSIPLVEIGSHNLVLVDEGHKGSASEEKKWKKRQHAISKDGLLMEYSATFSQAIAAASRNQRKALYAEYGKSILFDYSYRYFYEDGYGKDFNVLNLSNAQEHEAEKLLMGGLLLFYQQWQDYRNHEKEVKLHNIAMPLWVFIGSKVSGKAQQSDIARIVSFLGHFLSDKDWATDTISRLLRGESGHKDESGQDVFKPLLKPLQDSQPDAIYADICRSLLGGHGELEVWEIKGADGELGLKVSAPNEGSASYFGLINIGDVPAFKKHLLEHLGIEVREDRFSASQFADIERKDSTVRMLIGAKKFIEGWSCWRVSCMGLLNMGQSEGSQVIQLFGRGVRLKGKGMSLKRTANGHAADWLKRLETLFIFGWNGDYIARFKNMIEDEGFVREMHAPAQRMKPLPKGLLIPQRRQGYDVMQECWALDDGGPDVVLDLSPKVSTMAGKATQAGFAEGDLIDFSKPEHVSCLDIKKLYLGMLDYKKMRGFGNLYIRKSEIPALLGKCKVRMPKDYSAETMQKAAFRLLCIYMDRFYARQEREAESRNIEAAELSKSHSPGQDLLIREYRVSVSDKSLVEEVNKLIADASFSQESDEQPIPRLHVDIHLYHPLVWNNEKKSEPPKIKEGISISPPPLNKGEASLIKAIRDYWERHKDEHMDKEIYILRNLPHVGVGLFHRSGFFPDFLLWVKDNSQGSVRLVFLEPHGMRQETQGLGCDKIMAILKLRQQSCAPTFSKKNILIDGYIVTDTPRKDIDSKIDEEGLDEERLAKDYALILVDDGYKIEDRHVEKILWS